ncbi:xylulokinase [Thalassotalea fonticola]|uniref:Xylulose kinase n=1 Tax=Thalassotalea fonticola TaxID=3065649 RepID=A0ABZ0GJV2_9GAMM|nr:xylulokinase [Colwelliaceae bacterium S1-1]
MYLGIDLGTSGVKVVVIDEQQHLVAQATVSLKVSRPNELWSEQEPEHWWQATNAAMAKLKRSYSSTLMQVKSIGLSGQMHGATVLDQNNKVLRPAILWNDGRSEKQCIEIEQKVKNVHNITGNLVMPGFTAPKLLWLHQHENALFNKINKVLLPKDYLRFLMTGDFASDLSDSAGTLWLDVEKRQWSTEMLSACHLNESQMPALFEGTEITSLLSKDVADNWGMKRVPVAAGAGDNAAGAAGIGVVNQGDAFLSLGTSGVYFVANDAYRPNPTGALHTFCHCFENRWHQMSVILSAASCLSWVTNLTGAKSEAELLAEVAKLDFNIPCEVTFLPYLSGERTPHNNPHAKGVFFGLSHTTNRAVLCRAVLEGVAYAFADGQQALIDAGTVINQVSVIGGGSRSQLWGKILASTLNKTLVYRKDSDVGPAFGAANLARLAISDEAVSDVCIAGEVINVIEPDPELVQQCSEGLALYRNLYQSLKPHFSNI